MCVCAVVKKLRASFVGMVADMEGGGGKPMPMALEWCPSPPHNRLIAVCHNGTAALWLFPSSSSPSPPTAQTLLEEGSMGEPPLLQFIVNNMPLRSVAWAPPGCGSQVEENVLAISGNGQRIYLWDLRDPFQPIDTLVLGGALVTQLTWIKHPRSLIAATDDGHIRVLCFDRDIVSTEEQPLGAAPPYRSGIAHYACQGTHLWDLSVSHAMGLVAYGGVDGEVFWFQLNPRNLTKCKNDYRHKVPHVLCGGFALDTFHPSLNGERRGEASSSSSSSSSSSCIVLLRGKAAQAFRGIAAQSAAAAAGPSPLGAYATAPHHSLPTQPHPTSTSALSDTELPGEGGEEEEGRACGVARSGEESGIRNKKNYRSYRSAVEMATMADTPAPTNKPLCTQTVETAVHRLAWGPTMWDACGAGTGTGSETGMSWLAYAGKAGLVRCQVVAELAGQPPSESS